MTDPANMAEIWPCLIEVYDVRKTPEGTGTTYKWVYKMAGEHFEGTAEITECIPNQRLVVEDHGGIEAVRTTILQPLNGGTKYTVLVEYIIPISLLSGLDGSFIRRLNECETDVVLANLKARMEAEALKT